MEVLGNTLFIFALAAYFGSAGAYAVGFTLRHGRAAALAFWLMLAGAAAQFVLTSVHLATAHRLPLGLADGGAPADEPDPRGLPRTGRGRTAPGSAPYG